MKRLITCAALLLVIAAMADAPDSRPPARWNLKAADVPLYFSGPEFRLHGSRAFGLVR